MEELSRIRIVFKNLSIAGKNYKAFSLQRKVASVIKFSDIKGNAVKLIRGDLHWYSKGIQKAMYSHAK